MTEDWEKRKRLRDDQHLSNIELQIAHFTDERGLGFQSEDSKLLLNNLEKQKIKLLQDKEEQWRLKSRAIWLQAGDSNTKFFHNLANGRKASNTIWQLPSEPKGWATTHQQLARLGISHFKRQFTAPTAINLPEIINLAGHLPRFFEPEDIEELIQLVTMEELEGTLKWFKKDKGPGPDGWPMCWQS